MNKDIYTKKFKSLNINYGVNPKESSSDFARFLSLSRYKELVS